MDSEREGLPRPMTSYSQKGVNNVERTANISSSDIPSRSFPSEPQSHPYQYPVAQVLRPSMLPLRQNLHGQESNSSTLLGTPGYSEATQQADHHHQDDHNVYDYPSTYIDDMGAGVHPNDPHPSHNPTQAIRRYPSASEATIYPPDLNTPLSVNFRSLPIQHRLHPASPLVDYRDALRGYHHLQSHNLQQQQQASLDRRDQLQSVPPLYHQGRSVGYAAERDSSDSPDPLQHSHPQMHQHSATSSSYDSVNSTARPSGNNPSHTSDARSVGTAHSSAPYRTRYASSSIPMSNNPPPHPIHAHHDFEPAQSLGRENVPHQPGRNMNPHASTVATPQTTVDSRSGAPNLVLPSISGAIPEHHPSSRSTPDPSADRLHNSSHPHSQSVPAPGGHSPPAISDTESTFGSDSIPNEESDDQDSSLRLRLPGQADGQLLAGPVKGKAKKGHGNMSASTGEGEAGKSKQVPVKKKKKSKMHECQVCKKKFPRPSGLNTHMNIHSNERPYACGFPGCTRTFGVRSNAKRHLRTHGVIPAPSNSSSSDVPYVVGFSTPVILQPHSNDMPQLNSDIGGESRPSSFQPGAEHAQFKVGQVGREEPRKPSSSRVPAFKVRWMPPSLTARSNASKSTKVQDGQGLPERSARSDGVWKGKQKWTGDEMDEDDDEEEELYDGETAREMDHEDMDDEVREARMFSDAAAASRLSIPLRPVMPSSGSSSRSSGVGESSRSGSGLSLTVPSIASPSPSSPLYSVSGSSLHSATSFTLPQSASLSPVNQPGEYTSRSLPNINQGMNADFEERISYLETSSHLYHPSQRHNKNKP